MERKRIYILIVCFCILLGVVYYLLDDKKEDKIVKTTIKKELIATPEPKIVKKEINKPKVEKKIEKEKVVIKDIDPIIEKETVLSSSKTKDNKYYIKLKSDKKVQNQKSTKYIPLKTTLSINENKYLFNLSLNENYSKDYESFLYIEIYSIENDKTAKCDGYFLKGLDVGYINNLKLDSDGNEYLSCYIEDTNEISDFALTTKFPDINPEHLPKDFLKKLEERKALNNQN